MKVLPLASLALVASLSLTSCVTQSGEVSEIEKRNKFDACVLDYVSEEMNRTDDGGGRQNYDPEAWRRQGELACRDLLK